MTDEIPATVDPDEPDPPYVDNSPAAAPGELDDEGSADEPRNDVVEDLDPESEPAAGVEP